ncbi:MAG: NIPSNAP family protein [Armatimonadota bacterium]
MTMLSRVRRTFPWLLAACASCAAITAWTAEPQSPSIARDSRLFEMRTYYAAPGKFEALHARFRDHTNRLFKKHGMQLVGYWVPTDKEKGSENTLIYVLAFPSKEAREASFRAFGSDPEWKAAHAASEANGKLVDKIESVFMNATDYSPIK